VSDPRPDAIIGQLADENLIDQLAAANAALEARVAELEAEVARLQARVQELEAAHDKNIRKAYSTRQLVGKGHHCMWREAAEAMEQRARAALAAVSAETEDDDD
jgi:dynactin complex subunit